ncbi:MAG: phosphate-starvation-inducible PsiE family protein [Phycisphaerales bacterium]|nr:phosphate-starvation-inducible PsiE family protein [Phycisphaerales bacterium]
MEKILKLFERSVVLTLLGLMMLVVLVATVELAVVFIEQLLKPPVLLLDLDNILHVFGFFMMVLIGLELLESIKAYLREDRAHAEVVFLVALVAIARKVIILDYNTITPEMLYGIATVIVALGVGYFLVRRALQIQTRDPNPPTRD